MLAEPRERLGRARSQRAFIDDAEPARQCAEHQIFRDRQLGYEMQFLIDDGDAGVDGGLRARETVLDAVEAQRSGFRNVDARQHLEQRRLACPVLAHEAVHFTGPHVQRHAVERAHAGEADRDPVEFEVRRQRGLRLCAAGRSAFNHVVHAMHLFRSRGPCALVASSHASSARLSSAYRRAVACPT